MSEFQREHRYWVIKRKHLTPEQDEECRQLCGRLRYEGVPEVETVSVESDWPIYEIVWHLVERLATGQRLPFMIDEDPDKVEAKHDALAAKSEHLQQEAMAHAQEARTQRATVLEIYQLITGASGEPGDWHGAEPVRQLIEQRDALAAHLEAVPDAAWEALQRLIENAQTMGEASREDALLVAHHRDRYRLLGNNTSLARLKEERAMEIQQAVKQARREWAAQGSPWVKAYWQAVALEEAADDCVPAMYQMANWLRARAEEFRRQVEEPTE